MRTINSNPARICVNGACVDPGEGVSCGATEGCVLGMCVDSWAISIFRARRSIERTRDCSITARSNTNAAFVFDLQGEHKLLRLCGILFMYDSLRAACRNVMPAIVRSGMSVPEHWRKGTFPALLIPAAG